MIHLFTAKILFKLFKINITFYMYFYIFFDKITTIHNWFIIIM